MGIVFKEWFRFLVLGCSRTVPCRSVGGGVDYRFEQMSKAIEQQYVLVQTCFCLVKQKIHGCT